MTFGDSSRTAVRIARETTFNTKPEPFDAQALRFTKHSLAATKETELSAEIRADRMISENVATGASSGGAVDIELSLGGSFDMLLEAALGGALSTAVAYTGVVEIDADAKTLGGTGIGTHAVAGQKVKLHGCANAGNNGWFKVTAVSANALTVADPTNALVDETSPATATVKGRMLRNGTNIYSHAIETAMLDVPAYQLLLGQCVSQFTLDAPSKSKITGSFQFMGANASAMKNTSDCDTVQPVTTTSILATGTSVGSLKCSQSSIATALKAFSLQVNNNTRGRAVITSRYPISMGQGRQAVTGKITAYFQDITVYNAFFNDTRISLELSFDDNAGNGLCLTLPKLSLSTNAPAPSGTDTDIVQEIDFVAEADATTSCHMQLDFA